MSEDGEKKKVKIGIIAEDMPFDFSGFANQTEDQPFTCEFCNTHYEKGHVYFMQQKDKDKKVGVACSKCAKQRVLDNFKERKTKR